MQHSTSMRILRPWLVATALLLLLGGCAQPPKKQAFNRAMAATIKTMVIAQRPNQTEYMVDIVAHPGQSFGLVGGLIEGIDGLAKTNRLTAVINPGETRLQDRFSAKLSERLAAAGYATRLVVLPSIPPKNDELLAKVKAQADGDVVLAIAMYGRYVAAGITSLYLPEVRVSVRLLDLASGAVLYEESIHYGTAMPQSESLLLPSDPQYRFATFDALVADGAKAREGLLAGLDLLAAQVAADLKRN